MKSIIIVTFNSQDVIKDCMDSVLSNVTPSDEIYIVDNNSTDQTVKILKDFEHPNLFLIQNENNSGFATAVNQGIKASKGEFVFLINPDTEFHEQTLAQMVSFASKRPEIGIVGAGQISGRFWFAASWGNFPSRLSGILRKLKLNRLVSKGDWVPYNLLNKRLFTENRKVDWVSGGFMLIKREVIDKIGKFDEKFFMYYEDVDYCKRAEEVGFEVWYMGRLQVIHYTGMSSGRDWKRAADFGRTSRAHYLMKYRK